MNLLALESSTDMATVALKHDDKLWSEKNESRYQHGDFILNAVDRILKQANTHLPLLDGIVFGRGPGSFTGIRLACSVAKGLAFAHKLPVYPVSTLAAIAYVAKKSSSTDAILSIMDARMDQVYWAIYQGHSFDALEQVSATEAIPLLTSPYVLAGHDFDAYLPMIKCPPPEQIMHVKPDAATLIDLVEDKLVQPVSAKDAMPSYVRQHVTS